jgi:hypothetical protein
VVAGVAGIISVTCRIRDSSSSGQGAQSAHAAKQVCRLSSRSHRISTGSGSWQGQPLARWDGYVDGVVVRRERAGPAVVVPAGRVVQEVQVDDERLAG